MPDNDKPVRSTANLLDSDFPDTPSDPTNVLDEPTGPMPSTPQAPPQLLSDQERIIVANVRAINEFHRRHPEYLDSDDNNNRMADYMNGSGLPVTVENLEGAYTDLRTGGWLELDPMATPAPSAPPRRVSTGLSDRPHTEREETGSDAELSDKLAGMPLDQARRYMMNLLRQQQRQGRG